MITIRYFASLRDEMGCSETTIDQTPASISALIDQLIAADPRAGLLREPFVRIIVNDEISNAAARLAAGDTVAFCPPFSGG